MFCRELSDRQQVATKLLRLAQSAAVPAHAAGLWYPL
jgi:hypothetical protein